MHNQRIGFSPITPSITSLVPYKETTPPKHIVPVTTSLAPNEPSSIVYPAAVAPAGTAGAKLISTTPTPITAAPNPIFPFVCRVKLIDLLVHLFITRTSFYICIFIFRIFNLQFQKCFLSAFDFS